MGRRMFRAYAQITASLAQRRRRGDARGIPLRFAAETIQRADKLATGDAVATRRSVRGEAIARPGPTRKGAEGLGLAGAVFIPRGDAAEGIPQADILAA